MKVKITKAALVLAAIILISIVFVPTAAATPEDSLEKWTKDHTVKNVKLTTTYKYEDGYLEIKETYSGSELKKKTGLSKFNKEKKIPLEIGTVMVNKEGDELTVTENELILKTKKDGTIKLEKGKENVYTTKISLVMTLESDPYPWWIKFDYPQWTWSMSSGWYVREDPINMVWEEPDIGEVKYVVVNYEKWTDNPSEYTHYVFDYLDNRWEVGDGVAESVLRITGGYHARLWTISTDEEEVVIANAHKDDSVFNWPLGHQAIEYEGAEDEVAGIYSDAGWNVDYDAYFLKNRYLNEYDAFNNGKATVITP
ncbi:hypothetical protein [Methanolobus sp. WCC4]|uniref:hypothetical protein n=1 Tax=Methanolobus sp. WCC4 TaxID=3125784 RepID=UPI0030F4C851